MAKSNCYGCPNRNTAENPNPDCHTDKCESWAKYQADVQAERNERYQAALAKGMLADGYMRSKGRWLNKNQNRKQSVKINQK